MLQSSTQRVSLATVLLVTSGGVISGGVLLAQQPGGGGMQPAPATQQGAPGQPGQPGAPGQPGSPTTDQPSANNLADQGFVRATLKDDEDQVQLSQLAQQKSSSADIKKFSQAMIQVHDSLDKQLMPIAKQFEIKDPQKPSKKEKKEMGKLQAMSGPDFDTAYLQAMAKDQQHTLKEFSDEQKASQSPSLKQAAKVDEPTLTQNFTVLQQLAAAHHVTLDEKK